VTGSPSAVGSPPAPLKGEELDAATVGLRELLQGPDLAPHLTALRPGMGVETLVLVPREGAPLEHTFSHERHVMHLFCSVVQSDALPALETSAATVAAAVTSAVGDLRREARWMTAAEAGVAGMTSGVRKVFSALGCPAPIQGITRGVDEAAEVPPHPKRPRRPR